MIKIILTPSILLVALVFTGCGKAEPKPAEPIKQEFACQQDGVLAPEFTCNPIYEDYVVDLGIAQMNAGGDKSFQRTEALSAARENIANQIEVKVSNLFKKYIGTTGAKATSTFDKASSDVSKMLASQTLSGSKQIGRSWRHPKTNELFLMVGIPTSDLKKKMDQAITTSFKNEPALYQQFLAEKANGELDKELENK